MTTIDRATVLAAVARLGRGAPGGYARLGPIAAYCHGGDIQATPQIAVAAVASVLQDMEDDGIVECDPVEFRYRVA